MSSTNRKLQRILYIGDNDLTGNKFNGHDLHLYMRERGLEANHLVRRKASDDPHTFEAFDCSFENFTKNIVTSEQFINADLVHLHLIHNTPFDLNYLPIISQLKPVVWSLHDPWVVGAHCIHHGDCQKWQTHCHDCPYPDAPFAIHADTTALAFEMKKSAIQSSNIQFIVASEWMREKALKSAILQGKPIYHIPIGIHQGFFKPGDKLEARKKLGIPEDNFVLLMRTSPAEFKGLNVLKEALHNVQPKHPVSLITVGVEKEVYNCFNGKYQVLHYGWLSDDELLRTLYWACDILLAPSRQETYGLMAVESMSCGKMVLATDVKGSALPTVIHSPDCGLAVQVHNYAQTLQYLLENPSEVKERGERSYEYARAHYGHEHYIDALLHVYEDAYAKHTSTPTSLLINEQLRRYKVAVRSLL